MNLCLLRSPENPKNENRPNDWNLRVESGLVFLVFDTTEYIKRRPRSIILRAIRYRAVLRAWAFRPKELEARRVSVMALNGMTFDLATPPGRMMATVLAGIAEFERELIQERIRSGIAAAKARGKRLGRQPGQRPKSDRLAPKVVALVAKGRSYRLIGREVGLSKNTVADIVKRHRAEATQIA